MRFGEIIVFSYWNAKANADSVILNIYKITCKVYDEVLLAVWILKMQFDLTPGLKLPFIHKMDITSYRDKPNYEVWLLFIW